MSTFAGSADPGSITVSEEILSTEVRCEDEAIRVPGAVQQHGFLLVTDAELGVVLVASENAETYLRLPLGLILRSRLDTLLERELLAGLRLLRLEPEVETSLFLGSYRVAGQFFSVVTYPLGTRRVLEFELQDRLVGSEMMNGVITNFVGKLSRLQAQSDLCDALAKQVADLTGYDRVLLYSFDQEEHGTVLAEVNNGRLPSYLGLRFPASDIPKQARDLYVLNTVRVIPDADYTPSRLQGISGEQARDLDLSMSLLRSVSPTHLKYMHNMGTMASMSVSLVMDGRLWGLVSAHNAEPKLVPYVVRSACDMLSKVAGTQLASFMTATQLQQTVQLHAVQRNVMAELAAEPNYLDGLRRLKPQLLSITNAAGVALVLDGHVECEGETPNPEAVDRLTSWLEEQRGMELWSSSHLASQLPWTSEVAAEASGLLAIRISATSRRFVLWFRPEVVRTVRWAGEPGKIMDGNEGLSPRNSFDEWKETVRGRSLAWDQVEIESARDFRSALTTIGLRRAEEAIELGEARFQRLTQAVPVRVFTADDSGRLTYTNDRWQQTGMAEAGKWFEESLLTPEDALRCAALWEEAVRLNRTFEAEVRLRSYSDGVAGPERWNFVRAVPFHRAGAERAGWIGCFVDLTESKEREMALRMHEKLAQAGRMTSVIAHEINNPLEAITNLMFLLRSEINASGPASSYIGMVESELERISGITKQTLRWNRESTNTREAFRAGPMVDDVLRLFAGKIRNRQITIRLQGDRETQMTGVVGQLRQVLANLISNAVDAAPVGGEVTIRTLGPAEAEGRVGFTVRDNGKGIPAEIQARLFEPFHSTKGDLGNGLGLYISREIVEQHHGVIEVAESGAEGTTMRVLFPVDEAETDELQGAAVVVSGAAVQ